MVLRRITSGSNRLRAAVTSVACATAAPVPLRAVLAAHPRVIRTGSGLPIHLRFFKVGCAMQRVIFPSVLLSLSICGCSSSYELTRKLKTSGNSAEYETSAEDWAPIQEFDGYVDSSMVTIAPAYLGVDSAKGCEGLGFQVDSNAYEPSSLLVPGAHRVEVFYNHFLARLDEGYKGAGATLLVLEWDKERLTNRSRYYSLAQSEPCNNGGLIDSVSKSSMAILIYGRDSKNRIIWFEIPTEKLKRSSIDEMKASFLKFKKESSAR
jgi:hypothetical protein